MKLDITTRMQAIEFISRAAILGNLGLFIGSGFSKAVINHTYSIALSWDELLEKVSNELEIEYASLKKDGISFPEIASEIVRYLTKNKGYGWREAQSILKKCVAKLTSWYPDKDRRELFSKYLISINPSWIITTNYELIIESLLTGLSVTIGPNSDFIRPRSLIPVFHIHGIRTDPESIIITQEDYVTLFRPNEYRQIKLALTIKESTTVIIGYGLGDVNVLTAMDWSENVFKDSSGIYPRDVIQIIRTETPKTDPYRDDSGILIIETNQIEHILNEISEAITRYKKSVESKRESFIKLANDLNRPDSEYIKRFIDDGEFRIRVLELLAQDESYFIAGFMEFLFSCIDETWKRAEPNGAFFAYDENLRITLDIFDKFSVKQMPPALFESLASNLERVGHYVGRNGGQSWDASRTWEKRRPKILKETEEELINYATQNNCHHIRRLLGSNNNTW